MVERVASLRALVDGASADRARLQSAKGPANQVARRMLELQERLAREELQWLVSLRRDLPRLAR